MVKELRKIFEKALEKIETLEEENKSVSSSLSKKEQEMKNYRKIFEQKNEEIHQLKTMTFILEKKLKKMDQQIDESNFEIGLLKR